MAATHSARLKLGIIGGGLVSHWHARGIRLSNRWEIVAGALSSDPDKARRLGAEWRLHDSRVYTDYRVMAESEAARDDGIDAVAICTPNDTHCAIAETFMAAGIHVVCDKPLVNTRDEAHYLLQRYQECNVVFAVTYPYVYYPMVRQAREMIQNGSIGNVRQFMIEYVQEWAGYESGVIHADADVDQQPWRQDPERAGPTSTTGDIGTHAFHMLEYVTGDSVESLSADFHVCGPPRELEDTAFIRMRMAGGAPGVLWLSQVAAGEHCGLRFRIYGDRASLRWDQEHPEQLRYAVFNEPERVLLRGQGGGMHPSAEQLTQLPRGHGEALSDAWAGMYAEIADAVYAKQSPGTHPLTPTHYATIYDGARGVSFNQASADSHASQARWTALG